MNYFKLENIFQNAVDSQRFKTQNCYLLQYSCLIPTVHISKLTGLELVNLFNIHEMFNYIFQLHRQAYKNLKELFCF